MRKILFSFILLLVCACNCHADDNYIFYEGLVFTQTSDDEVCLVGVLDKYVDGKKSSQYINLTDSVLTVPSKIVKNKKVSTVTSVLSVGKSSKWHGAWHHNGHLPFTKVVLPNTIRTISRHAFGYFEYAQGSYKKYGKTLEINIPESVVGIDDNAFACSHTKLNITWSPSSLEYIGRGVFHDTTFDTLTIPKAITRIESEMFRGAKIDKLIIPNHVTHICDGAFKGAKINSIAIPNSVTNIGNDAFCEAKINCITLSNGIKEIGDFAFRECEILDGKLIIPASVEQMSSKALYETNVKEIVFESNKPLYANINFISSIAYGKDKRTRIVLPDTIYIEYEYLGYYSKVHSESSNLYSHKSNGHYKKEEDDNAIYQGYDWRKEAIFGWKWKETPYKVNIQGHTKLPVFICMSGCHQWNAYELYADVMDPAQKQSIETSLSHYIWKNQGNIQQSINSWAKKGEFETIEKYNERVTAESRDKLVNKLINDKRDGYISANKNALKNTSIGTYDPDRNVFPLDLTNKYYNSNNNELSRYYIKVPLEEAPNFKANKENINIVPKYDIVDDHYKMVSCTAKLAGKTYECVTDKPVLEESNYQLSLNLPVLTLNNVPQPKQDDIAANKKPARDDSIDKEIPQGLTGNNKTFAVIIGNENYQRVSKVEFAKNDAKVFAEYCKKTLGLPEQNVKVYQDATFGNMMSALENIKQIAAAYKGKINVLFYYAGHGIPNEDSRDAFLLPVDLDGSQTKLCLPVSTLYSELGSMNADRVVVLMDACFSGAQRGDGMLMAARGVAIKAKQANPLGNIVALTAATDDQTAYPFKEKGHGMFTYFLLKKLQESKGNVSLDELSNYIKENVTQQSVVINGKPQTPTFLVPPSIGEQWKTWKLQ